MTATVVLVTGASRGLGAAMAGELAAFGETVIGVSRTPPDEWQGGAAIDYDKRVCDITDESSVRHLFAAIRHEYGALDTLLNNAGMFSGDLLLTTGRDRFASILQANLLGAHLMTREAVKLMRPMSRGRVVSISSVATSIPQVGNSLYGIGKGALERLMRDYAVEFRGSGITFNCVAVSFFEDSGMASALKPEARERYEARLLVPRAVGVGEVLGAVRYFRSDEAATVTGQVIDLGSPY
jgi:3-oxoacyl-[acyl-carrier protein] reductase